jgi:YidC/Oxa1 family membrane protein insertase
MEHARILIAIVLSFLVFLVWDLFFVDRQAVKPPPQQQEAVQAEKPVAGKQEEKGVQPYVPPQVQPPPVPTKEAKETRTLTVKTPLFTAVLNEKGAVVQSLTLSQYKETVEADSPPKELVGKDVPGGSVRTAWLGERLSAMTDALYTPDATADTISVDTGTREVGFSWASEDGIVVEKRYRFSSDSYLIGLTIVVKNGSAAPLHDNLLLSLLSYYPNKKASVGFLGSSALIDGSIKKVAVNDVEDKKKDVFTGKVEWVGLQYHYFMSAIIPGQPAEASMRLLTPTDKVVQSQYTQPVVDVAPGTQKRFEYQLFFGPKSVKTLRGAGHELDRAIDFGWFDIIARPCLWLMNFIYGFIPNYGIAIIFLTLITKLLLWPLGNKSYKSMGDMKRVQPLVAEIREKYKDDKKKMNQEMMALYRTYKINPLGGCLPMAAQIPVFIALYRMLYEAIELRHAPFFSWINDLSAPDRLFRFNIHIPFMEPPYGIPVLTLIMGATMFLQQKMSPPAGDPSQAKMMMLMPIVFTVIFINFPAGLVLYWLTNNILSIAQQYYVQRKKA